MRILIKGFCSSGHLYKQLLFILICLGNLVAVAQENCSNGIDDDGDGLCDAIDPDCSQCPFWPVYTDIGNGNVMTPLDSGNRLVISGQLSAFYGLLSYDQFNSTQPAGHCPSPLGINGMGTIATSNITTLTFDRPTTRGIFLQLGMLRDRVQFSSPFNIVYAQTGITSDATSNRTGATWIEGTTAAIDGVSATIFFPGPVSTIQIHPLGVGFIYAVTIPVQCTYPTVVRICEGDSAILKSIAPTGAQTRWNTGETTNAIQVKTAGMYSVQSIYADDTLDNYFDVRVGQKFKVFIGADTAFCGQFAHKLDAGRTGDSYVWSTKDTTTFILVNQPGMYAVAVKDIFSCGAADTILIDQLLPPEIVVSYDPLDCKYVHLDAGPAQQGIKYLWSTGDTTLQTKTDTKGKYTLTAFTPFCNVERSVTVNNLPTPDIDLPDVTDLCGLEGIRLTCNDGDRFRWSTNCDEPSIFISKPGTYKVTAFRGQCETSDSTEVILTDDCEVHYFIPDAFTPNNDGMNDLFSIVSKNIDHIRLSIYNRWGAKIYEASGPNPAWDGTLNGEPCPEGVYIYSVSIDTPTAGTLNTRQQSGNLTLIR